MRDKLIVGNWKMNGGLASNARLLDRLASGWIGAKDRVLAVCVPAPYFAQAQAALTGSTVAWGAQDVSEHAAGAYTGETSAAMVAEFDCRYAIVGHSERRQLHGETDAVVAAKARAALAAGLTPIACVGETLQERQRGDTDVVVARELDALTAALGVDAARILVAYEPVWAMHAVLRSRLADVGAAGVGILYGGSVKAANAAALFAMPDIDGALVGGASLDADEFMMIGRA